MSASKGGIPVTKLIVYVIGSFYRIHKSRGSNENLNTPPVDEFYSYGGIRLFSIMHPVKIRSL